MSVFNCKMCGGALEVSEGASTVTCEYCGRQQTLPRLNDDKKSRLYERANQLWRNKNYDKAMGVFESILEEDNTDAETYWSLVLCRYGIEYVVDPKSGKRIPTINRVQYTSILADEDYKSALRYSDIFQQQVYCAEAQEIEAVQQRILAVSQKEEPFDVFICYKETDELNNRTRDSVIATEIYNRLSRENLRVFFSRITLEDKLGEDYEPYIFSALNSAKVMIVLGTKLEYFDAVWVKNEWSRFYSLIKNGEKKMLIAAYKDLNPYDLPQELSMQAQDMGKMGFLEDLVHVVIKNVDRYKTNGASNTPSQNNNFSFGQQDSINDNIGGITAILGRISVFLENGDWMSAETYCEKALDIDPHNSKAHIYKLCAQAHQKDIDSLIHSTVPLDSLSAYNNAMKYADSASSARLSNMNTLIKHRINQQSFQVGQVPPSQNYQKNNVYNYDLADMYQNIPHKRDSKYLIFALIILFFFWPVSIYFFYKYFKS